MAVGPHENSFIKKILVATTLSYTGKKEGAKPSADCHRTKRGQCLFEVIDEYSTRRNPLTSFVICIHCKFLNARFECNDIVIFKYSHYPLDPNAKSSDTKVKTFNIR